MILVGLSQCSRVGGSELSNTLRSGAGDLRHQKGGGSVQHNTQPTNSVHQASTGPTVQQLRAAELALEKKTTQHDLASAAAQLRARAEVLEKKGLRNQAATEYLFLGKIYFIWGRYPQALKMYRRALRLTTKKAIELKCSILSHIAVIYANFAGPEDSLPYSDQAIGLSKSASSLAIAEANQARGLGLLSSNDSDRTIAVLRAAQETFKSLGDENGQARSAFYLGIADLQAGSTTRVLAEENEALSIWKDMGNPHGVAEAYVVLGLMHSTVGEQDKAVAKYQQAQEIFRNLGDRVNEAAALNGLGVMSRELGDYEAALGYHKQARRIFASAGDKLGELAAIDSTAKDEWLLHDYRKASLLYISELKDAQRLKNYREEAAALSDLGDIYAYREKYSEAERLYTKSRRQYQQTKYKAGEADILTRFGRLYAGTNRYEEAKTSFTDAIKSAQSVNEVTKEAQAHYELASLYRKLRQLESAKSHSESAIATIERQRTKVADFQSRATYFASVHEYYQLYIDILMQLDQQRPEQGFAQQAFEASEKSKVRSLLDMLASSERDGRCAPLTQRQGASPGEKDQIQAVTDCTAPSAVLNLRLVQDAIRGDDSVLLEYALGPEASYLWAVDSNRMSSYRLPSAAVIRELVTRYRDALIARQQQPHETAEHHAARVDRADKTIDSTAREVSELLVGPASELLEGKKRVVIVPDGVLQYIPFAALPLPAVRVEHGSPLLVDGFEVVSLPSASTLAALREAAARRTSPPETAAVFADPVFSRDDPRLSQYATGVVTTYPLPATLGAALRDAEFGSGKIPRLPASRIEAENIEQAFPPGRVLVATDFEASRQKVMATDLRRYRYIHFATHGILDSAHPEFSGLILSLVNQHGKAQEGYLRMREVYNLQLSADLVVLSSCNSALGKDLQSEGIIGLTRAFLYAGSQRVVSTLWKVNDQATAKFMQGFYSRLHDHESPAAALRGAQSDLARDPIWNKPYYWAGFILQGEYR